MTKLFNKTQTLECMYELKRQGYRKIVLEILEDGSLYLGCDQGLISDYPKIDIDSAEDWTTDRTNRFKRRRDYWWIFD